jgi:hypothetical protein
MFFKKINFKTLLKPRLFLKVVLVIYVTLGIFLRWEELSLIHLIDWWTRDFDRAFNLIDGNYFPLAGPETTGGGRLPGPFLYLFLSIPLLFKYSYESIFFFNFILSSASLIGLFFVVRRYFDFYVAAISTILYSVHILNLYSVSYPINPSFLAIFLIGFLAFFMEFVLNKNLKAFVLMLLIITLAAQIHFSIATYYLVVIAGVAVFRIKIPLKTVFISTLLVVICYSPYIIYKNQYFEATIPPRAVSKAKEDLSISLKNFLNVISVHKTINRVSLDGWSYTTPFYMKPVNYSWLQYGLLFSGFYGLVLFVGFSAYKKGIESYKKEISLILLFYFPALIFAYISPTLKHWWYILIFLPSSTIICAIGIRGAFIFFNKAIPKLMVLVLVCSIVGYLTFFPIKNIKIQKIFYKNPGLGTVNYFPLKNLIKDIAKNLKLSPKQYSQRVFFDPYSTESIKSLEFAINKEEDKLENNYASNKKECFYIVNAKIFFPELNIYKTVNAYRDNRVTSRLNMFLLDKTIESEPVKKLRLKDLNSYGEIVLAVYKYRPKLNQPCFQNSSNQFSVNQETRELLFESNEMKNLKIFTVQKIKKEKKFNPMGELQKYEGVYYIYDPETQTPIKIKLNLTKVANSYLLRGDINYYSYTYFSSKLRFMVNKLTLVLEVNNHNFSNPKSLFEFDIVSPDSWIGKNMNRERMTNELHWYKETELPSNISLKENDFEFNAFLTININKTNKKVLKLIKGL